MDDSALIALTVGAGATASLMGTVLAPTILDFLNGRRLRLQHIEERKERLADKEAERKERSEVAAKAAEAARLLLLSNREMAEKAEATLGKLNIIDGKVDVIDSRVDGHLTLAMQAELEATIAQLATDLRSRSAVLHLRTRMRRRASSFQRYAAG